MDKNQSLKLASAIFGVIALIHLLRSILNWNAIIDDFNIPVWFSYIAAVVAGYLSLSMYNAGKK